MIDERDRFIHVSRWPDRQWPDRRSPDRRWPDAFADNRCFSIADLRSPIADC